jgi:hypothetical protein
MTATVLGAGCDQTHETSAPDYGPAPAGAATKKVIMILAIVVTAAPPGTR